MTKGIDTEGTTSLLLPFNCLVNQTCSNLLPCCSLFFHSLSPPLSDSYPCCGVLISLPSTENSPSPLLTEYLPDSELSYLFEVSLA